MALAANSVYGELGKAEARELQRLVAEGIPECLHVGERVEARIWRKNAQKGEAFNLTVHTDSGEVSVTPERINSRDATVTVTFRGEKFGRERVVIRAPERADVAPLTAFINVLPSIGPPRGLSTQVTDRKSRVNPYKNDWYWNDNRRIVPASEIILGWQKKNGVDLYYIELFDFRKTPVERPFAIPGTKNSYAVRVVPGKRYYWLIYARIDLCGGGRELTPKSALIPFDA
jgi:hypothetical protein